MSIETIVLSFYLQKVVRSSRILGVQKNKEPDFHQILCYVSIAQNSNKTIISFQLQILKRKNVLTTRAVHLRYLSAFQVYAYLHGGQVLRTSLQ